MTKSVTIHNKKLWTAGNNLVVAIPKAITELFKLKKGDKVNVKITIIEEGEI
jgi:antitoxin component of MazEF toxin-antitoxin module